MEGAACTSGRQGGGEEERERRPQWRSGEAGSSGGGGGVSGADAGERSRRSVRGAAGPARGGSARFYRERGEEEGRGGAYPLPAVERAACGGWRLLGVRARVGVQGRRKGRSARPAT